jgi:hypothetical protein
LPFADDIQQTQVVEAKFLKTLAGKGVFPRWDFWTGEPFEVPFARTVPLSIWYTALLSRPWGEAVGVKLAMLSFLVLAAWGGRAFILRLTGLRWVAWLGGLTYALNRFALFEHIAAGHFEMTFSYAWFPWWMVCLDRALSVRKTPEGAALDWRWGVLAGGVGGGLWLGDIQFAGMEGVMGLLFILFRYLGAGAEAGVRRLMIQQAVVMGVFAVAASLYLTMSLISLRPFMAFHQYGGSWLESLTTTWGDALNHWAPIWNEWTKRFSSSPRASLLSAWPWLLVLALLVWRRDGRLWYFLTIYLLSMGMALAHHGPFGVLYDHVPFFKMFRAPIRFYNMAGFALAFLGPMGVEVLRGKFGRKAPPGSAALVSTVLYVGLLFGVADGPKAWETFKTGPMYPGREDVYRWMLEHPQAAAATQYPFNFLENRSSRWGLYQHEHRDPMAVGLHINTRASAQAFLAGNLEATPESLSRFLSAANIGYVMPRTGEAMEDLRRVPGLTLAYTGAEGSVFRHEKALPLLRVVSNVVGLSGAEAGEVSWQLFDQPGWQPESWGWIVAETPAEEQAAREVIPSSNWLNRVAPPKWHRARWAGPETTWTFFAEGARLTVRGRPGEWSGWRRGRVAIDTTEANRFVVTCRAGANTKFRFQFVLEDGQQFLTDWSAAPPAWQPVSLEFKGGLAIVGAGVHLQTVDGQEAWWEMKEMHLTGTGPLSRQKMIDDFRGRTAESPVPLPPPSSGRAVLLQDQSDPPIGSYRCEVENQRAQSLVVIADRWYPSWRAKVDGREAPVWRAYGAFIGVPVKGTGRHRVEVDFGRTPPQVVGWWVGWAVGLILLVCGAWWKWRPTPPAWPL